MTDVDLDAINEPDHPDEQPPGFRSWKSVYWLVIGVFVFKVFLLAVFTWTYAQ
jgi:hypothetical protein